MADFTPLRAVILVAEFVELFVEPIGSSLVQRFLELQRRNEQLNEDRLNEVLDRLVDERLPGRREAEQQQQHQQHQQQAQEVEQPAKQKQSVKKKKQQQHRRRVRSTTRSGTKQVASKRGSGWSDIPSEDEEDKEPLEPDSRLTEAFLVEEIRRWENLEATEESSDEEEEAIVVEEFSVVEKIALYENLSLDQWRLQCSELSVVRETLSRYSWRSTCDFALLVFAFARKNKLQMLDFKVYFEDSARSMRRYYRLGRALFVCPFVLKQKTWTTLKQWVLCVGDGLPTLDRALEEFLPWNSPIRSFHPSILDDGFQIITGNFVVTPLLLHQFSQLLPQAENITDRTRRGTTGMRRQSKNFIVTPEMQAFFEVIIQLLRSSFPNITISSPSVLFSLPGCPAQFPHIDNPTMPDSPNLESPMFALVPLMPNTSIDIFPDTFNPAHMHKRDRTKVRLEHQNNIFVAFQHLLHGGSAVSSNLPTNIRLHFGINMQNVPQQDRETFGVHYNEINKRRK